MTNQDNSTDIVIEVTNYKTMKCAMQMMGKMDKCTYAKVKSKKRKATGTGIMENGYAVRYVRRQQQTTCACCNFGIWIPIRRLRLFCTQSALRQMGEVLCSALWCSLLRSLLVHMVAAD